MRLKGLHIILLFIIIVAIVKKSAGQLSVNALSTAYTIDFSGSLTGVNNGAYTGTGFQSVPAAGQLDSDGWAATGWTDGALAFGGTRTAASDYTRGTTAVAVTTGGFYTYTGAPHSAANPAFYIQPGGSDWAPGTLTLRILNNTGSSITDFAISYNLFVRNDQGRSNSINFSYSTDDVTYTPVAALDYTSIAAADALGYVQVGGSPSRSTTISSLSIANGAYFYIRWNGADVGGSGSRDEFAIDDISVTGTSGCIIDTEPTIDATGIVFSDIACNAMTLAWTVGDGTNRIVVAKSGSAVTGTPTDQTTYTANAVFGSGSTIAAGEFVVYKGTGNTFTLTGISASTTYHFKVFEFNGGACQENYFSSGTTLIGNQASIACSECPRLKGVLINSCQGTCSEGDNELLFLTSGSYSIPVSAANIVVKYEAANPATVTFTDALTTNAGFITTLNTTAGCGTLFYDAMAVGRIPPNTEIIIMRSTACYGYDFSTFCSYGPIYVVFSADASWTTGGNFSNSCAPLRYFRTDFSAIAPGCIIDYNYDPCLLTSGGDGDAITFPVAGGAADNYFNDGCQPSIAILPIELLSFTANYNSDLPTGQAGNAVDIKWSTASETNNDFFTIERSADGMFFTEINVVDGAGNSTSVLNYSTVDGSPLSNISYYRLKQTDFNGNYSYSEIISVEKNENDFEIVNTLYSQSQNQMTVYFNCNNNCRITFELYDLMGRKIYSSIENTLGKNSEIIIPTDKIAEGVYLIKAFNGEKLISKKIRI